MIGNESAHACWKITKQVPDGVNTFWFSDLIEENKKKKQMQSNKAKLLTHSSYCWNVLKKKRYGHDMCSSFR